MRRIQDNEPGFESAKFDGPWVDAMCPVNVSTDVHEQAMDAYGTVGKVIVAIIQPFMKGPVDEDTGVPRLLRLTRMWRKRDTRAICWCSFPSFQASFYSRLRSCLMQLEAILLAVARQPCPSLTKNDQIGPDVKSPTLPNKHRTQLGESL